MNCYVLKNVRAAINGVQVAADLTVKNGKITALNAAEDSGLPIVDGGGMLLLPGFMDLHTHGADGVDVNEATPDQFRQISRFFASQGVTGWLCSILTDTKEQTLKIIAAAREVIEQGSGGAALLGIHLEGPCLSTEYKGAMPESLLMHQGDPELFAEYQKAAGGHIRYVTISPEIPGAVEMIPRLRELGMVVAIGHSGAGYDVAAAAVAAGAASATHLGNAERLFHQHDPAIWGVAIEKNLYLETIADGRHLHPGSVRLYLKAGGWDRVIAITDSIMATGLPDGQYKLGVNDVTVVDGDAKLTSNGVRAGSTLTLAQALRNLVRFTGRKPEEIVRLMSANPAALMGWHTKGEIATGMDADLVLLDKDLQVCRTIVAGKTVYVR